MQPQLAIQLNGPAGINTPHYKYINGQHKTAPTHTLVYALQVALQTRLTITS